MTLLIRVWLWFSRKISVPSCQLLSKGHPSNWLSLVLQTMLSPSSSLTPFLGYKGGGGRGYVFEPGIKPKALHKPSICSTTESHISDPSSGKSPHMSYTGLASQSTCKCPGTTGHIHASLHNLHQDKPSHAVGHFFPCLPKVWAPPSETHCPG